MQSRHALQVEHRIPAHNQMDKGETRSSQTVEIRSMYTRVTKLHVTYNILLTLHNLRPLHALTSAHMLHGRHTCLGVNVLSCNLTVTFHNTTKATGTCRAALGCEIVMKISEGMNHGNAGGVDTAACETVKT